MMSLMQPRAYKSQQNHKSSHRCLPHSINTVSIWLTVVYQSAEYARLSLASPPLRQALMENTQYYINSSGFTLWKCLLILSCCQSCYFHHRRLSSFICLSCGGVGQVFVFGHFFYLPPFFIFMRIQFADAAICISCKVKLLATAQSLIFQDSKGSRRLW